MLFLWEEFWKDFAHEKSLFLTMLLYIPVASVAEIVIMMLSITVGSVVARKLKVLAAIGIYYAIQVGVSTITTVIMVFSGITSTSSSDLLDHFFLYPTVLMAALGVGAYFLMHRLVARKLNLP